MLKGVHLKPWLSKGFTILTQMMVQLGGLGTAKQLVKGFKSVIVFAVLYPAEI